jgi:hypothetical protein
MLKLDENRVFDLLAFFEGRTTATGVFEDRSGRLKRRFTVDLAGRETADGLILGEQFLFDDGERQNRVWTLVRKGNHRFSGTCGDAARDAVGRFEPGRAHLDSTLRIPVGNRLVAMDFADVFYDVGSGSVLNRSVVSKWGVRLGQVLIVFSKPAQRSP